MKKQSRYFFYLSLIFLGMVFGIILTSRLDLTLTSQANEGNRLIDKQFSFAQAESAAAPPVDRVDFQRAFIEVNKRVTPSVVRITALRTISMEEFRKFHRNQNRDFWDFFNKRLNPFRSPREFHQGGAGSGIIVHPKGYILTNTHVVKGADQVEVTLMDERTFPAQIVGADSLTEVAVIKIEADDLPVARLGDSDKLEVGQWVMAIGNPLELRFTVTAGIISAIGRQMRVISDNFGIENFIQTDAGINPGNSGGPLVNLRGEGIGVNTAIATRSGYYEGYGFAIPINLAKSVMEDIITKGRVLRAYLGIAMLPMDSRKAKAYGLEKPRGVFIDSILPDGPAGKVGIQPEDILLAVNGAEVNRPNQVQALVAQHKPNEKIVLKIYRKGKILEIPVVLGERDFGRAAPARKPLKKREQKEPSLGLEVKDLSKKEARELGLEEGVVVSTVEPFSAASEAGLVPGDVILKLNDEPVKGEKSFWKKLDALKSGDVARILVYRAGNRTHVFLEIP